MTIKGGGGAENPVDAAEIARLENVRDIDIDFTDAPEVTPEAIASGAVKIVGTAVCVVALGASQRGACRSPCA
ncbi:MAG TPA: hypothetical protein PKY24_12850 [Opitutaceae bacterium]|mgnify:CR=1 FL=1|nr:hypothetical protein [Opitutaceae bacterium]